MKIDGYVPPDKELALEKGRTFVYELPFGEITIVSKLAGKSNFHWRNAVKNYSEWKDRRDDLNEGASDKDAAKKFAGIVHRHLVISWSTTIKVDGGKAIEPSLESFILLMTSEACEKVLPIYLADAADEKHFRAVPAGELEGNSEAPSDGPSDGQTKKSGSGK